MCILVPYAFSLVSALYAQQMRLFFSRDQINSFLNEFNDLFSKHKFDIGCIKIKRCWIDPISDIPISIGPFWCSIRDQELLQKQIDLLLEHKLIQPSISPYSAPVTLVSKKDEGEKSRLVVDFRALNKITIVDSYPFPRIEDIIDKLHGSKIFTTLDISSGFWYVQMKSENVHKTAFSTQSGHHEFLVCPFGFRNSPAIFQRAIFRILGRNKLTQFAHNYLDDIDIMILWFIRGILKNILHIWEQFFKPWGEKKSNLNSLNAT